MCSLAIMAHQSNPIVQKDQIETCKIIRTNNRDFQIMKQVVLKIELSLNHSGIKL